MMKIGVQLYTVRQATTELNGLAETLKRIADIGYSTIQISCTCPFDGAWMNAQLKQNGLECVLTHQSPDGLKNGLNQIIADHNAYGCKHIGLGYYDFDPQKGEYEEFVNTYRPITKQIKEAGKLFMYHNHDGEFRKVGGKLVLERMLEDFPADELGVTLDTFWVQAGGGDPAQWLEKLAGRIPCIHLKDMAYGRLMAPVGEGNINFDRVFEKAEAGGTQYMLVEQDECYGEDPFDCLRRSYEYLKSCGFH